MLIEHRSEGKTLTSFAAMLGVSATTLTSWANKFPEFKEAKDISKLAAQSAWEDIAIRQANGTIKGSAASLIFMLKNQFSENYKEKHEVVHSGEVIFQIDTGIKRPQLDYVEAEVIESKDEDLL